MRGDALRAKSCSASMVLSTLCFARLYLPTTRSPRFTWAASAILLLPALSRASTIDVDKRPAPIEPLYSDPIIALPLPAPVSSLLVPARFLGNASCNSPKGQ